MSLFSFIHTVHIYMKFWGSRRFQNLFGTFFILIVQSSYKVAIFKELGHDLWCQFLLFTSFATFFFWEHSTTLMLRNMHIHSPIWTHAHTHTLYPYEHLWRTESVDLEVDEVTTDVSLLTGTSPTIEKIASVNLKINLGKCKHPCQI
jgi:hypothetical protein